jgi:hypothetical protein
MSHPDAPQDQRAITLSEFVASTRRDIALDEFHWVFVDPGNDVIAAYLDFLRAIEAFFERLAADPVAALDLRIYTIDRGELVLHWPNHRSPLERARRLFDLNVPIDLGPVSTEFFHEYFLCADPGEIQIGDRTRRMFELWWPDEHGQRNVIGHAIEGDTDPDTSLTPWQLWTVHGTRETDPEVIETRLAKELNTILPREWAVDQPLIRTERHSQRGWPRDLRSQLVEVAIRIAEQFELLDPDGQELR